MPGRNHTGPFGAGPRTGRGMGYCGSYEQPGFANEAIMPRGRFGFKGGGAGRGWRHRFYATGVPGWAPSAPEEQEIADLKAQADQLKMQLDAIQKRIQELTPPFSES